MLEKIGKAVNEINAMGFDAKTIKVNLRDGTGGDSYGISVRVDHKDPRVEWRTVQSTSTQIVDGKLQTTPCEVQTPAGFLFSRSGNQVFLTSGLIDSDYTLKNFTESFTKIEAGELIQGWMVNNKPTKIKP